MTGFPWKQDTYPLWSAGRDVVQVLLVVLSGAVGVGLSHSDWGHNLLDRRDTQRQKQQLHVALWLFWLPVIPRPWVTLCNSIWGGYFLITSRYQDPGSWLINRRLQLHRKHLSSVKPPAADNYRQPETNNVFINTEGETLTRCIPQPLWTCVRSCFNRSAARWRSNHFVTTTITKTSPSMMLPPPCLIGVVLAELTLVQVFSQFTFF